MQQFDCSYLKDEQGFETQQISVQTIQILQQQQQYNTQICQAKDIIQSNRPTSFVPRRKISKQNKMHILPQYMNDINMVQMNLAHKITLKHLKLNMNKFQKINGKNRTIYDYILENNLIPIYRKYIKNSDISELRFNYANKSDIIKSPFDYEHGLYYEIKTPLTYQRPLLQPQFDSNFQSGNLYQCFRSNRNASQYYLILQNDTNTYGYNEWFFFRVRNIKSACLTFKILNLCKQSSLHKEGMKIAIFSQKLYKKGKIGWFYGGRNIFYYNDKLQKPTKQNANYYCLTFSYDFTQTNDSVYFALTIPYTYTKLLNFLQLTKTKIQKNNQISIQIKTIGFTHYNNQIPSVIIQQPNSITNKPIIFIMARQHPAQTVSSFILQGFLQYFTLNSQQIKFLIKKYTFIIIPMVNPDGVIEGHSRCNVAGLDINRQWNDQLSKDMTPQTFFIKKYIKSLHEKHEIHYFIDLHGHSKKMNTFFFACKQETKVMTRLFSAIMSKIQPNFDMMSCTYNLGQDKQKTIRYQLYNLGIKNSFTLETSYYGKENNNKQKQHFTIDDLKNIGRSLIIALFVMNATQIQAKKLYQFTRKQVLEQTDQKIDMIESQQNQTQIQDSQSDPDCDILPQEQKIKYLKKEENKMLSKGLTIRRQPKYESPTFNRTFYKKLVEKKTDLSLNFEEQKNLSRNLRSAKSTFYNSKILEKEKSKQIISKTLDYKSKIQHKRSKTLISDNIQTFKTNRRLRNHIIQQKYPQDLSCPIQRLFSKQVQDDTLVKEQELLNSDNIFSTQYLNKPNYLKKLKIKIYKKRAFTLRKYKEQLDLSEFSSKQCQLIHKLNNDKNKEKKSIFYDYPML